MFLFFIFSKTSRLHSFVKVTRQKSVNLFLNEVKGELSVICQSVTSLEDFLVLLHQVFSLEKISSICTFFVNRLEKFSFALSWVTFKSCKVKKIIEREKKVFVFLWKLFFCSHFVSPKKCWIARMKISLELFFILLLWQFVGKFQDNQINYNSTNCNFRNFYCLQTL